MQLTENARAAIGRFQKVSLALGVVGLVLIAAGFTKDHEQFYQSWLLGFIFCLALPLGSLGLLMINHLSGGAWGGSTRRILESNARTIPLFALLFVPIWIGRHELYHWTHADAVATDAILQHKAAYLNEKAFLIRAIVYFSLWSALAYSLSNLSRRNDQNPDYRTVRTMVHISGPGLVVFLVSINFAIVDWVMSTDPHWYSTIYGVMFMVGMAMTTFATTILIARWLSKHEPFARVMNADRYHELGKLMFATVLLWGYTNLAQYLIIWSANLAEETPWYIRRNHASWQLLVVFLIACQFALPFLMLLSRRLKKAPALLSCVCVWLLVMRFSDLTWHIVPNFHREGFHLSWMDFAAALGIGGAMFAFFAHILRARALLSAQDAHLEHAVGGAHH